MAYFVVLGSFLHIFFSILVMLTTYPVTKKCMTIILEATPENINVRQVYKDIWALNKTEGKEIIKDVHDLHVW